MTDRWWPEIGQRVRLKSNRSGIVWDDHGTGTGKRLNYTCHEAKAGDFGTVTSTYLVTMDSGIEISCHGNDFSDPDEQFAEWFELVQERDDTCDLRS